MTPAETVADSSATASPENVESIVTEMSLGRSDEEAES